MRAPNHFEKAELCRAHARALRHIIRERISILLRDLLSSFTRKRFTKRIYIYKKKSIQQNIQKNKQKQAIIYYHKWLHLYIPIKYLDRFFFSNVSVKSPALRFVSRTRGHGNDIRLSCDDILHRTPHCDGHPSGIVPFARRNRAQINRLCPMCKWDNSSVRRRSSSSTFWIAAKIQEQSPSAYNPSKISWPGWRAEGSVDSECARRWW